MKNLVHLLAVFSLFAQICSSAPSANDKSPNVIIIFADDLGYGDTSIYGATKIHTPNIDRLARQGRRFTDAHTSSSVCTPSRYVLLTGEYAFRAKYWSRGKYWSPASLKERLIIDPNKKTLADIMKAGGYATACIGKWHLGFGARTPDWNGDLKPGPLELGFDHYFGVPVLNSHPPFVYVEDHRVVGLDENDPFVYGTPAETAAIGEKMNLDQIGGSKKAHRLYDDYMIGTTLADKAVNWIKTHKDEPFFLYLPTTNIHHPFTPHPRFQGTSEAGRYGDFVHELDWIVGEVTRTLEEEGLADDTLVIFTSDNGGMINLGGQEAWRRGHQQNGELLGFKFDAWEGGHRVPFIARWPGRIPANTVSDQLISTVDMMATFAAVTGQKLQDGQAPDSLNLLPALTGDTAKAVRDHLVLTPFRKTHLSLRSGDWVYISGPAGGGFDISEVGERGFGGYHALHFSGQKNSNMADGVLKPDAPAEQLYNLRDDPHQSTNVIQIHATIAQSLREKLVAIQAAEGTR